MDGNADTRRTVTHSSESSVILGKLRHASFEKGVPAQPEELQFQDRSSRTAFLGPYFFVTAPPTELDDIAEAAVSGPHF